MQMAKGPVPKPGGRRRAPPSLDDPPLIRVLIAESTRSGDRLADLAAKLGVTYQRFAQWRRGDADMAHANRSVLQSAAKYLGVPTAFVLCLVGIITLEDLLWPTQEPLQDRVRQALENIRNDPYFAGLFPDALMTSAPEIQYFVAVLHREIRAQSGRGATEGEWMQAIHRAAVGNAQAQLDLASLRADGSPDLF